MNKKLFNELVESIKEAGKIHKKMNKNKGIAPSASESLRYKSMYYCDEGPVCPYYGIYAHGHLTYKDGMSYKAVEELYRKRYTK